MPGKYVRATPTSYRQMHKRSTYDYWGKVLMTIGIPRTSKLRTPLVRLEDHRDEILSCAFHPFGELLLSSGRDGNIHVCNVYEEKGQTLIMHGHKAAVVEAHFSRDGLKVYTCSLDKTVAVWDSFSGYKVQQFYGHTACVNSVQFTRMGANLLCSGSDDGTVRIWDVRINDQAQKLITPHRVFATCFNQTGDQVIFGGLNTEISIWDARQNRIVSEIHGHLAAVTGISLSPCGNFLLSHSTDESLRISDIRPASLGETHLNVYNPNEYAFHGNLLRCAWSQDSRKVSAGTSGNDAYIRDSVTGKILTQLEGHVSNVNDIAFHPTEPIFMSASSDGYIFLSETKD